METMPKEVVLNNGTVKFFHLLNSISIMEPNEYIRNNFDFQAVTLLIVYRRAHSLKTVLAQVKSPTAPQCSLNQ